jgi:circadian clock protein KaiB
MAAEKSPATQAATGDEGVIELRLYIAGQTRKSVAALTNLRRIGDEHLAGRYRVEVIDLMENPQRAQRSTTRSSPSRRWCGGCRNRSGASSAICPTPSGSSLAWRWNPSRARRVPDASQETLRHGCRRNWKCIVMAAGHPGPTGQDVFVLRLYVTGTTGRSTRAIANLREVCEQHLSDRYELEVVDVYQQPELAAREQLVAVPTLIRRLPLPLRRLVGDLSNRQQVLAGLDLSVISS